MVQAPYLFYVNKAHVSFLENSDQVLWVCAVWSAGLRNVLFADLSGWSHLAKSKKSVCCSDRLVLSLCHCCVQCSCVFCRNIIWWLGYKLHGLLCTHVISNQLLMLISADIYTHMCAVSLDVHCIMICQCKASVIYGADSAFFPLNICLL